MCPRVYVNSALEMEGLFGHVPEALSNTAKIADMVEFHLDTQLKLPRFDVPAGFTIESYFEKMARAYAEPGMRPTFSLSWHGSRLTARRRTILAVETPGTPMTLVYDGADGFKRQGPLPKNLKKDEVVHVLIVDEAKSAAPAEDDGWQAIRDFTGLWKDGAQTDYSENHDEYIYARR